MDTLLAFAAGLVSLRLAAKLVHSYRRRPDPSLGLWALSLVAFALACAALAWGSAAGWDEWSFRAYYLFGGLLAAALLGFGSLARAGWRASAPLAFVYLGLAIGIALAEPVGGGFPSDGIPAAQDHLDLFPARIMALLGNSAGTLAAVAVALLSFRQRPLGSAALLGGLLVAGVGSSLSGLGAGESAAFLVVASALLYAGFVVGGQGRERSHSPPTV